MMTTSARAVLTIDGKLEEATASADIGTGTYTILAQIAADALGVSISDVTVKIGDSSLPSAPVEGGSATAASAGSAVHAACSAIREKLFEHSRAVNSSPLADAQLADVAFEGGRLVLGANPSRAVASRPKGARATRRRRRTRLTSIRRSSPR